MSKCWILLIFALVAVTAEAAAPGRVVWSEPARYPEGPMVRDGVLYWAEMRSDSVRRRVDGVISIVFSEPGCGPTSVKPADRGELWVLCHLSDEVLRINANGEVLLRLSHDGSGGRLRNPNDAAPDGQGGLFVSLSGRFAARARSSGRVVHIGRDGSIRTVAARFRYANGVSFDATSRQLLISEHLARKVWRLQLSKDFSLLSKQRFADFDAMPLSRPGYRLAGPDGIAVLSDGHYLVAEYGASRLIELGADGEFVREVEAPAAFVTNAVVLGDELVITSSSINASEPYTGTVTAISWEGAAPDS
ncbi:MAG: SMP-30/gluconolactonase/LRE family protein [Pseudomonadaceae bacterium]|nr:SMP-30/gluconolactonase/LRE family protein [Pseudomonadaceae bacterium]